MSFLGRRKYGHVNSLGANAISSELTFMVFDERLVISVGEKNVVSY